MFDTLIKGLVKHPKLAQAVLVLSSTPTIHIGMTELSVSVHSQKSFDQKLDSFLNLVPDQETLKAKITDYVKIQEETKKEISDRITKIQDLFESLVEALTIEETKKFNEKLHKLAEK